MLCSGSFWTPVITLANTALGAGILTYPFAYSLAGIAVGSVLTITTGTFCVMGVCIIFHCMGLAQQKDASIRAYGDLVRTMLGTGYGVVIDMFIVAYMFGACIGYMILLADQLGPIFGSAAGLDSQTARLYVTIGASVVCLGLSLLPNISSLRYTSFVGVMGVFLVTCTLVMQAVDHPCRQGHCLDEHGCDGWPAGNEPAGGGGPAGVSAWPQSFLSLMRAPPLIGYAMQSQIQTPNVYAEAPAHMRTPWRLFAIGTSAYSVLMFFYVPTGIAGYMRFGLATNGDILTNFNVQDQLSDVARACISITALSAFPMQHFPARLALHSAWAALRPRRGSSTLGAPMLGASAEHASSGTDSLKQLSTTFIVVEGVLWTSSAGVLAYLVGPAIAKVFGLIGAVCGGGVIFVYPGLLWAKLGNGAPSSARRVVPAASMLVVGVFIMGVGTYMNLDVLLTPPLPLNCTAPPNSSLAGEDGFSPPARDGFFSPARGGLVLP